MEWPDILPILDAPPEHIDLGAFRTYQAGMVRASLSAVYADLAEAMSVSALAGTLNPPNRSRSCFV